MIKIFKNLLFPLLTLSIFTSQVLGDRPIPPSAPSNLSATGVSTNQVNLYWRDNSYNETGFIIQRSINNLNWNQIATTSKDINFYNDSNLFPNTSYFFRVQAYNSRGNSLFSNIAKATTLIATNIIPPIPDIPPITNIPPVISNSFLPEENPFKTAGLIWPRDKFSGVLKCLALRLNFQDYLVQSFDPNFYKTNYFDTYPSLSYNERSKISKAYEISDMSYGQLKLVGDIYPTYITLPINSTCDSKKIIKSLFELAPKIGLNLNNYQAIIGDVATSPTNCPGISFMFWTGDSYDGFNSFAIPQESYWWGWAEATGFSINGVDGIGSTQFLATKVFGHVLGHQLGFGEDFGWWSSPNTILGIIPNSTENHVQFYSDELQSMSGYGIAVGHYPARQKEAIGWLSVPQIYSDGTYLLNPYELPTSKNKAFKIAVGNNHGFYYLEYRLPLGIDQWNEEIRNSGGGVALYYVGLQGLYETMPFALDLTPAATTNITDRLVSFGNTFFQVGQTFFDPWSGFSIKLNYQNQTEASITIQNYRITDTTPPRISLLSLNPNFSGATKIVFSSYDENGINKIEAYEDNKLIKILKPHYGILCTPTNFCGTDYNDSFLYIPSSIGPHEIKLKAFDCINSNFTAIILNALPDVSPTSVYLSSPTNNQIANTKVNIVLNNGQTTGIEDDIMLIQLYKDNELVGWTRKPVNTINWFINNDFYPYMAVYNTNFFNPITKNLEWNSSQEIAGNHTLTLKVYDYKTNVFNQTINIKIDHNFICHCSINPMNVTFPAASSIGGQSVGSISIVSDCAWDVSTDFSLMLAPQAFSGVGNGTLHYQVNPNTSSSQRVGHIFIGDQVFTITQDGFK